MTHQAILLRLILFLGAIGFIGPMLGCGSGSGSAAITESRGSNSTTPSTDPSSQSQTNTGGCGPGAFSPNYANLIHPLYHWSHSPVKVYFANSVFMTSSDGSNIDLRSVALNGFQEWPDATGGLVTIQVTSDPGSADIVVHINTLPELPTTSDVLGLEQSTLDSSSVLQHADITLNTWPHMTPENITSFQETSSHEFGHALGINGHSDDPSDVMFASHSLYVFKSLSVRDINTLKNAYCGLTGKSAPLPASGAHRIISIP